MACDFSRVRVPIGVIGIIYESRPNVTADAGGLCLKSGNAAILRGGSDSFHSSAAIVACLQRGLDVAGLAAHCDPDGADCRPRLRRTDAGGPGRHARPHRAARRQEPGGTRAVRRRACRCSATSKASAMSMSTRRPTPTWRSRIVLNAKMRRTGVCGAAETILIDRAGAETPSQAGHPTLIDAGCEVRGDVACQAADPRVKPASEEDWSTEYLDAIVAVKVVDGVGRGHDAYRALRIAAHRFDRDR